MTLAQQQQQQPGDQRNIGDAGVGCGRQRARGGA